MTRATRIPALTPSSVKFTPMFTSITIVTTASARSAGRAMVRRMIPGFITVSYSVRLTTQSANLSAYALRSIGHGDDIYSKNDVASCLTAPMTS